MAPRMYSKELLPLPEGHRFPMGKYALLRERLVHELPAVDMQEAPRATDGELALVHTPSYIDAIAKAGADAKASDPTAAAKAADLSKVKHDPEATPANDPSRR